MENNYNEEYFNACGFDKETELENLHEENTQEKVYNECLRRMEKLDLSKQCISAFKHGKVWESEGIGALYELNEEEQKIVDKFEGENKNYKVYHIIHNVFEFGEIYSLLYVDTYFDEWKYFDSDLESGITFVYAYNKTDDNCSEFGSIGIKKNIGGLIRVC